MKEKYPIWQKVMNYLISQFIRLYLVPLSSQGEDEEEDEEDYDSDESSDVEYVQYGNSGLVFND